MAQPQAMAKLVRRRQGVLPGDDAVILDVTGLPEIDPDDLLLLPGGTEIPDEQDGEVDQDRRGGTPAQDDEVQLELFRSHDALRDQRVAQVAVVDVDVENLRRLLLEIDVGLLEERLPHRLHHGAELRLRPWACAPHVGDPAQGVGLGHERLHADQEPRQKLPLPAPHHQGRVAGPLPKKLEAQRASRGQADRLVAGGEWRWRGERPVGKARDARRIEGRLDLFGIGDQAQPAARIPKRHHLIHGLLVKAVEFAKGCVVGFFETDRHRRSLSSSADPVGAGIGCAGVRILNTRLAQRA